MIDGVASISFILVLLIPIVVFVRQIRQVRRGERRKGEALIRFFGFSILPVLAYVAFFFVLVGIEEMTKLALVTEGISRTLILIAGIGIGEVVLLTVVFAIAMCFVRPAAIAK